MEGVEARIDKVFPDRMPLEDPKCWDESWNRGLPKGKSKVARCHLLTHILGGSDKADNLVPCCQKANLIQWHEGEKGIRDFIKKNSGAVVDVKITVHYGTTTSGCPIPTGMTLVAKGSVCGGPCTDFSVSIRNSSNLADCPL